MSFSNNQEGEDEAMSLESEGVEILTVDSTELESVNCNTSVSGSNEFVNDLLTHAGVCEQVTATVSGRGRGRGRGRARGVRGKARGSGSGNSSKPRMSLYGKVRSPSKNYAGQSGITTNDPVSALAISPVSSNSLIPEVVSSAKQCNLAVPKNARSSVWMYFNIDENDHTKSICKLCNARIFRGEGRNATTSSMKNHLRGIHSVQVDERQQDIPAAGSESSSKTKLVQLDLKSTINLSIPWSFNDPKAMQVTKKIGEMLFIDNLPYAFVEKAGFRRLMKQIAPKYTVPGATYFSETYKPELLKKVKDKIKSLLDAAAFISLTTDIWTSATNHGFISLTAHWVTSNFDTHNFVLDMKSFPGSHTGDSIKDHIESILANWKIAKDRINVVLRDNGPNIEKGVNDTGLQSVSCIIHTLQLVVTEAMNAQRAVIDVLSRCRGIVGHVHRAHNISDRFAALQAPFGTPKVLVQDVTTRWNSTYYMLKRVLELKQYILMLLSEFQFTYNLNANDWSIIKSLVNLLEPFEAVTRLFSSEHCFISEVIPTLCFLKKILSQDGPEYSGIGTMKGEMLNLMNVRFNPDVFEKNTCLTFATLVDPRYKLAFFSNPATQVSVKNDFLAVLLSNRGETSSQEDISHHNVSNQNGSSEGSTLFESSVSSSQSIWVTYGSMIADAQKSQRSDTANDPSLSRAAVLDAEINLYLSADNLPAFTDVSCKQRSDPLCWWKNNVSKFPNIGRIVCKYLSAPASSVYSERLFSEAGNVYEKKRSSLTPQNASDIVFLKHNMRSLNYDYDI